ncbi:MAG TPA: type II secretion system protein GspK [bacterium]|nr:type II secretion system protein GspK [bacterium]HQP98876.1 type II secretion system protein GspK [bacterium]
MLTNFPIARFAEPHRSGWDNVCPAGREREQGVVLVLVLWVIVVLTTMTLTFTHETRLAAKMAGFQSDNFKADMIARAGLRQALILIREDLYKDHADSIDRGMVFRFDPTDRFLYDAGNECWAHGGERRDDLYTDREFGGGYYRVSVRDEAGKLPLNGKVPPESFQRLLMALGWEEKEALVMAGAIQDWRDADDVPTENGERGVRDTSTEAAFYNPRQSTRDLERFGPEYLCKNSGFSTTDELLMVRGITPAVYFGEDTNNNGKLDPNERDGDKSPPLDNRDAFLQKGLRDYVTVYSGAVNLNTAPFEVLYAVLYPLVADEAERMAQNIIKFRDGHDRIPYTDDDQPFRTWDNTDEDDIHFDKIDGMTPEFIQKLQQSDVATLRSDAFEVTVFGEFQDVQKGYRAIVNRQWLDEERLPLFGVDTNLVEDLEQVQMNVLVFEPVYNAEDQFSQSVDRASRRRAERSHRRFRRL